MSASSPKQPGKLGWARGQMSWPVLATLILAALATWPLFSNQGLLNTRGGGDSPFLLQRLHQLTVALADGHFPVRWMPDANYGYGYPFFNFYASLSIYVAAAFRLLGFSYVGAIQLAQLAGYLVAALATYKLALRWFGHHWPALISAAAYTFAPFHMVNVYVRGDSLAEFWAMALYPLVLLAADRLFEANGTRNKGHMSTTGGKVNVALFALSYASLVLSHNISALIFTPFLLFYLIIRSWIQIRQQRVEDRPSDWARSAGIVVLGLGLGLALGAWFWLPALAERSLAQLDAVTSGYFHFSEHFRGTDLLQTSLAFDYDVKDGNAFRMGLVQLVAALAGLMVLLLSTRAVTIRGRRISFGHVSSRTERSIKIAFVVFGLGLSTLMITPLSRPIWNNVPLLDFTQFPWRFLSIQALFTSLAAAGLGMMPGRRLAGPTIALILLFTSMVGLRADFLPITDDDVTPERLAEYEWFTGNIGSTVSAEYLPPAVNPRPFTSAWLNSGERNRIQTLDSVVPKQQLLSRQTASQSWILATPAPTATITLPTLYWPGWQATLDGRSIALTSAPGSGLISLIVPQGEHELSLQLGRTPIRLVAEIISLVALIAILWLLRLNHLVRRHRPWLILPPLIIFLGLIIRLWPEGRASAGIRTWDFAQLGYLHPSAVGVTFENQAHLQSVRYSADSLIPGDTLVVELDWQSTLASTPTIFLTTPAWQRTDLAPRIEATIVEEQSGGNMEAQIPIPELAPAGQYILQLNLDGVRALTPTGQPRGDLFLQPVRIVNEGQAAGRNAPLLGVRPGDIQVEPGDRLRVPLQWITLRYLTHNYNFSMRLLDSQGIELGQFDGQPGYGFQPSSLWIPGALNNDWLTLAVPQGISDGSGTQPFGLVLRLYDVETGQLALIRRLGELVHTEGALTFRETLRSFEAPDGIVPAGIAFGETIQLLGYDVTASNEILHLTLYWVKNQGDRHDYYHFVHLVDPSTDAIVAQHDSMPQYNGYPTSQWMTSEIVPDAVKLNLAEIPKGEYELRVGLYRREGQETSRLPAADSTGRPLPDNSFSLARPVRIED